jgi:uncharacterized membrane protein
MELEEVIEAVGKVLDVVGVAIIAVGVVAGLALYVRDVRRVDEPLAAYKLVRRRIGRVILLGLEVLVGADIIRTVATSPTFTSVGVLAIIVAIRTFLSFTLELEITGRWPWQAEPDAGAAAAPPPG